MTDFDNLRDQLGETRRQKEETRQEAFLAQERLEKLRREQARFARIFDPESGADEERMAAIEAAIKESETAVSDHQAAYAKISSAAVGLFKEFQPFTDPREMISQFRDDLPILLLPLRLETRFKTITGADGSQRQQLWVRVFPDDCAIDSFEPILSEAEIFSAQIFWQGMWVAAGDVALERGAWRGLVSSHGAGRAAWIARAYLPENPAAAPAKANPSDIVLVVGSEETFSAAEQAALTAYWQAVWQANGAEQPVADAYQALALALGADRAAALAALEPANFSAAPEPPLTRQDVAVIVAFLDFPPPETVDTKAQSWSQAPRVNVMPDRLVLLGYQGGTAVIEEISRPITTPLIAGPDPSTPDEDQFKLEDGALHIPEDIKWLFDFEQAVAQGMGFKIDLTPVQASRGFDRLLVLGVRLSANAQGGQELIETLFSHHHFSRTGISLLPQGTPTNNTEKEGAGFSQAEDADDTFVDYFKSDTLFTPESDPLLRRDGQWLADYLGLETAVISRIKGSNHTDQLEARAMNVALWSGTLGYMMDTMMTPLFTPDDVKFTRLYFTSFVSGRGALPALRIGKQPYGILPTSVFSRMDWLAPRRTIPNITPGLMAGGTARLHKLYLILRQMDGEWTKMADKVAYVGKPGVQDPHKLLLDVLGLHPASVEYHQRYAESITHLYNMMNIYGLGGKFLAAIIAGAYVQSGLNLLSDFGYTGAETPDILERLFLSNQHLLQGPVIDDRPLSETELIRAYTDDGRNYLQWLIDAANTSLETLRRQDGFSGNKRPAALLYIMLRYSLMQSYWITSIRLFEFANLITTPQVTALRHEPTFIHLKTQTESSESRFAQLYTAQAEITGSDNMLVADHITRLITEPEPPGEQAIATAELKEQVAALERLKDAPTARLERLFAEHIDTCAYRLDAWELGLLNYQLFLMRYSGQNMEGDDNVRRGLYVGAYGWLENLRPENKQLTPVTLDEELDFIFNDDPDLPPLMRDAANGGYIHAPSLNHAVTAAVLRNGYLSNATPQNPDTLAINLSSARVRRALGAIEGIRAGQSLGALLGYQFERGLHDRYNEAEVDGFIYDLRQAFPLRAKRLKSTKPPDDASIQALEARNVMDGLKLVEHIRKTGQDAYPFGKTLPDASDSQQAAINAEVQRMLDTHDAVADVAIAESVHHAVMGNYDRAAGTLDTYSKGNFPPIPEVIQTPRSGLTLTHRIGIHLLSGLNPALSPVVGLGQTPRGEAEPALNHWLAAALPAPDEVGCRAVVVDPVSGVETAVSISQADLGLQPIDLLYILTHEAEPALAELDDRVLRRVLAVTTPRPDAEVRINYTEKNGMVTFFELTPLIASLRQLLLASRPLKPSDVRLQIEANESEDETVSLNRQRLAAAHTRITLLRGDVDSYAASLQALLDDLDNHRDDVLTGLDGFCDDLVDLLEQASRAGVPQTGWGFVYQQQAAIYKGILTAASALIDAWNQRLVQFDAAIAAYDSLDPATLDSIRFDQLITAEQWVTTQAENPLPADPAAFRDLLVNVKRAAFALRLGQFADLLTGSHSLENLRIALAGLLPIDAFVFEPFDLTPHEDAMIQLAEDLANVAAGLVSDMDGRLATAQSELDKHDGTAVASEKVTALQEGAKALLGADFKLIPEFTLNENQGSEWQNAFDHSPELFTYAMSQDTDFPVDDWLYGVGRVREKMRHWERVIMLAEGFDHAGFSAAAPALTPVQFPYKENDDWLALAFPESYEMDGDRLLYTAHYPVGFNKGLAQCGLLVDEWSEVIPGVEETTGITFHYDRPNAEPPQVMLLATSPQFTGSWRWQDLVDTLHETLALARKRAVEPSHVDDTAFARFLPATVTAVTLYGLSISANLAANNQVYALLGEDDNE
ncbi:MAG: hypothetical protein R6X34_06110 [Chloroflexota bacterium]